VVLLVHQVKMDSQDRLVNPELLEQQELLE